MSTEQVKNKWGSSSIFKSVGGVAFYSGAAGSPAEVEAANWIKAVVEDTSPVVKPEQAYVVSQILEAIYESSKTGKAVYFE